eukprot:62520-Amphidinium_carterae.1
MMFSLRRLWKACDYWLSVVVCKTAKGSPVEEAGQRLSNSDGRGSVLHSNCEPPSMLAETSSSRPKGCRPRKISISCVCEKAQDWLG